MKKHPLHRRTRNILSSLAKELGTDVPWADCFAEIAALDEAVRKTFEPAELDQIAILDEGIEIGAVEDTGRRWWQFWKPRSRKGTRFYALTLNAEDWFEEWCRCWPDAPVMQVTGWLYASAHSMEPEALLRTWNDKFQLAAVVWLWRCRCGIKPGQIVALQRLLMPELPWPKSSGHDDVEKEGFAGNGWLTATLGAVGVDPDYWRNKVPMLKALQRYRDMVLYGEADKEVKARRWEQWRDMAEADVWRARKALGAAWKAIAGADGPKPTPTPPKGEEAPTGQPEAEKGQPKAKPPVPDFPTINDETVERMAKAKLAEMMAAEKKGA